ncbi:MAG: non-ribosomal peptide synthase/amino acid adenylation enzyme [Candidatus Eremiobacteraeota bacterium]|nr:non-ribosomal peptide synthase/amino acid adenylation enzyme [Candidatus Eremiobacteraeota bacterium]
MIQTVTRVGPASEAQRSLWLLDQLEGGTAYNLGYAYVVEGALDPNRLREAVRTVTALHEALRTTLRERDGEIEQVVAAEVEVPFEIVDLTTESGDAGARLQHATRLAEEDSALPFDLNGGGALWRFRVALLGAERALLSFSCHHVAVDGWSLDVLIRDLSAAYAGRAPQQAPLTYLDYTLERRAEPRAQYHEAIDYWRTALAGAPPYIDLPAQHPRDAGPVRGVRTRFSAGAEITERLERVAKAERGSLLMVLVSAAGVLASELTGNRDVVLGTPYAGRDDERVHDVVGLFANLLPLRLTIPDDATFAGVLKRTRAALLDGYEYQSVRLEDLVRELQPPREPGRNPLAQLIVTVNPVPEPPLDLPGVRTTTIQLYNRTAKFDMNIAFHPVGGTLGGFFEYDAARFAPESVERWARSLEWLLERIASDPALRVTGILAQSPSETQARERFAQAGSSAPRAYVSVLERIAAAAQRAPDAVALSDGAVEVRYRELAERARGFAGVLAAELRPAPQSVIAIRVPRSIDLVTALLAVQEAGCAFVVVDTELPPARVAQMVAESRAVALITAADDDGAALEHVDVPLIAFDPAAPPRTAAPAAPPRDALAYVIFTSGSTGVPKVAGVDHGALANLAAWHHDTFGAGPDDVALQVASASFDAFVWDVFSALCAGAHLRILRDARRLDFEVLQREMAAATTVFLPTPLAHEVFAQPDWQYGRLRLLLTGGDALRSLPAGDAPPVICNVYGPTECAVVSTSTANDGPRPAIERNSIGRPIAGARAYILDERLEPLPIGRAGELCVGGECVGLGYVNDPGATAAAFVCDPFAPHAGARMYRTGDMCRFLADGQIEFLGRRDRQIKLRGYRIELGEVESAIARRPGVAAVSVVSDTARKEFLAAFYVAAPGAPPDLGERIKTALREHLPAYMVPAAFVQLDELPRLTSGKIDYLALGAAADRQRGAASQERQAASPTEQLVIEAWCEVLGSEEPGLHDDFFDHGGNSLAAVRLLGAVKRRAGVPISLRALFEHPTVADIAALLDEKKARS